MRTAIADGTAMLASLDTNLWRRPLVAAILLVVAVAAAYSNSLNGAFVWDDIPTIVQNRSIEHVSSVFARPTHVNTASGRPLLGLSLALNYAVGGRSPIGFHLVNMLIHAAATLTLFAFVRRLALLARWGGRYARHATELGFAVAAAWGLHPAQTQAVTYVVQRAESLMGLFYLLTLWLFLRSVDAPRPRLWRAFAVFTCAFGMMTKEVMVSAPIIVALLDRTFLVGTFRSAFTSKKWFYAALFGTWLILFGLVARLGGNRDGSTGGLSIHAAWLPYWLTQVPALATYLRLAFWPQPLIFQYGTFWLPGVPAAIPAALVVAPFIAVVALTIVRWPVCGFFGVWFCSILAVTSIVPGTVDMIVDHRIYLALAPVWIVAVALLYQWGSRRALAGVGAVALTFAAITFARNRDYRSRLALWTDNVAKRPENPLARYNLAVELLRQPGRQSEAEAQLESALTLAPDFAGAHYNLAVLLSQEPGQSDQALAHYEKAIRIAPTYSKAHHGLATLLERKGKLASACGHLQLAVQSDPDNKVAWLEWVHVLARLDRTDDAMNTATALVRAHPEFADGQAELGVMLAIRQQFADAIPHLEAALRLDGSQPMARYYLASVFVRTGERLPEAEAMLEALVQQRPESADAHYTLGVAYLATGHRLADAVAQFEATVRLDPNNANAQFNLGAALEISAGARGEAITHYRAAATLQPNVAMNHFRLARLLAADSQTRDEARAEARQALALDPHSADAQALLSQLESGQN